MMPVENITQHKYTLFYKQHFNKQHQAEIGKNQAKAKQNYSFSSSMLSSKANLKYCKKCAKNKCDYFFEIIWFIIMKIRVKMKNGSNRCNIHRTRPRNEYKI